MNNKKIKISFFLLLIFLLVVIIIYANNNDYTFESDGVLIALTIDGTEATSFPTTGEFTVEIDCKNGKGKWLPDEKKLVVVEVTGNVKCNIDFTTKKDSDLLSSKITATTVTQGNEGVVNEKSVIDNSSLTNTYKVNQSDYNNLTNDSTYPWTWDSTEETWTSSNHTDSTTSTITFNPSSTGYYQFCYMQSSEKNWDYATISINNEEQFNLKGVSNTSFECKNLGNMATSDTIKITYKKDSSSSNGNDNVIFYLQGGTYVEDIQEVSVGYRYEGTNPDNYVWFNNELWRIIGLIPTKTSSGTENLVKIIRNASIGGLAYDAKSSGYTGAWGSNTLYTLLNNYFYGKQDGTDTAYCYGYQATAKAKCDYTSIGINTSDYYGSMVKNVYWNTGASGYDVTASAAYTAETRMQTVTGYIGLMSASDYGYASSGSHTTSMYSYNNATHTLGNWLYGNGSEWTSIQNSGSTLYALAVSNDGPVSYSNAYFGYSVRPVLHLDSSVYVINGSGTESDPYILGI